jgi:hypothetical protein
MLRCMSFTLTATLSCSVQSSTAQQGAAVQIYPSGLEIFTAAIMGCNAAYSNIYSWTFRKNVPIPCSKSEKEPTNRKARSKQQGERVGNLVHICIAWRWAQTEGITVRRRANGVGHKKGRFEESSGTYEGGRETALVIKVGGWGKNRGRY